MHLEDRYSFDSDLDESPRRSREASPEVSPDPSDLHPDSPPGEDDTDGEEVILIPVLPYSSSSFPHPHLLSTIPKEVEGEVGYSEDEDDTNSIETVRPTRAPACVRPDAGLVWVSNGFEHLCQ